MFVFSRSIVCLRLFSFIFSRSYDSYSFILMRMYPFCTLKFVPRLSFFVIRSSLSLLLFLNFILFERSYLSFSFVPLSLVCSHSFYSLLFLLHSCSLLHFFLFIFSRFLSFVRSCSYISHFFFIIGIFAFYFLSVDLFRFFLVYIFLRKNKCCQELDNELIYKVE